MDSKPILYLAQAYAINPDHAIRFCEETTAKILELGYYLFRPVGHTHYYEQWRRQSLQKGWCPFPDGKCDVSHGMEVCGTKDCPKYEKVIPMPDYVQWDLALVEAMCKDHQHFPYKTCPTGEFHSPEQECWNIHHFKSCDECKYLHHYQPKIVMVFASDCFRKMPADDDPHCYGDNLIYIHDNPFIWESKGAKQEFNFAKDNHIKCIRLDELLEKKTVEACEPL